MQTYVPNLRRALEPDRPPLEPARALVFQAGGYRLAVDPARLDSIRFESAARLGIRLLAEGRPSEARLFDDAVATTSQGRTKRRPRVRASTPPSCTASGVQPFSPPPR